MKWGPGALEWCIKKVKKVNFALSVYFKSTEIATSRDLVLGIANMMWHTFFIKNNLFCHKSNKTSINIWESQAPTYRHPPQANMKPVRAVLPQISQR